MDPSSCNIEPIEEQQNIQDKSIFGNCNNMIINEIEPCDLQETFGKNENLAQNYTKSGNKLFNAISIKSNKNECIHGMDIKNAEFLYDKKKRVETEIQMQSQGQTTKKLSDKNYFKNKEQIRYSLRTRKSLSVTGYVDSHNVETKTTVKNQRKCFDCPTCLKKFNDKFSLTNHCTNLCHFCKSTFCTKDFLTFHTEICKRQSNSKELCLKCKLFSTHSGTQYHICSKAKISFKCNKCNRIFNDEIELESHMLEKQCRNMEVFTCDTCKSIFTDFNVLKKHIAKHLNNPLQCLICNGCFSSEALLRNHNCIFVKSELNSINEHDSISSVNKFSCCSKHFRNPFHYKKHIQQMHNDKNDCRSCKRKFMHKSKFAEHLNVGKPRHKCDSCSKGFMQLSKLHIHILNAHHGVTYRCEKCNMKFISQKEHDTHEKVCKGEEPCSCKTCGKFFAKKDYLKKHEYIHSNVLLRCKFCHCAFMREKSYKKHIEGMNCSKSARKIRLSEFNYKKCRICNKDFNEEKTLSQHFSDDHPGENPHQCFCCESCLPTFKDLENHIHLHNIQKYTCSLCGKPYTSQEGFRKHRLKHKGSEYKCQFCDSEFLNERRFKFHVKTCKKNPESAYHRVQCKTIPDKKDLRPKQSRQLHWESRIIMKRLRGDPNTATSKPQPHQLQSQDSIINFFDEPDDDSNDSNVRGWFDNYYKTDEDDFAFGLKRENNGNNRENITNTQKFEALDLTETNKSAGMYIYAGNVLDSYENSLDPDSTDTSSEEEDIQEELSVDYNPKKCRVCLVTFSQEYELLHHFIKLHPNKKAHKCPKCDEECPLFAQLKEHMKTHGIGMGIYNCVNCSKRFRNEKKMKTHTIRCKGLDTETVLNQGTGKKFQFKVDNEDYCKRCCKTFQTKCGYRRHKHACKERRKSNKENKKTEAPSKYTSSEAVTVPEDDSPLLAEKHSLDTASPLQPKTNVPNTAELVNKDSYAGEPPLDSFPCRLCNKKFQYERGIVMHFKADHPGHKPLVCHICNMQLADKLKEHLKTHGIGEEFVCELCGKRFNQKFLSKIHEMWHQGVEYKCGNCKQKFLNKEKMDKHVSEGRCSNRQSLMRLPCDICGKSYRSKFGLSKHYITHTPKELRPIKNRMNCEFCGKWFETNNGLQRHRRIHTGERPFCCRFCSRSFVQEGNCKSHERIHTGEPRPRKKKRSSSEPLPQAREPNSCILNEFSQKGIIQSGIH